MAPAPEGQAAGASNSRGPARSRGRGTRSVVYQPLPGLTDEEKRLVQLDTSIAAAEEVWPSFSSSGAPRLVGK